MASAGALAGAGASCSCLISAVSPALKVSVTLYEPASACTAGADLFTAVPASALNSSAFALPCRRLNAVKPSAASSNTISAPGTCQWSTTQSSQEPEGLGAGAASFGAAEEAT